MPINGEHDDHPVNVQVPYFQTNPCQLCKTSSSWIYENLCPMFGKIKDPTIPGWWFWNMFYFPQ
jgi:hypothetical protein